MGKYVYVVRESFWVIQYFLCWSEYMKDSDKPLPKEAMRKLQLFVTPIVVLLNFLQLQAFKVVRVFSVGFPSYHLPSPLLMWLDLSFFSSRWWRRELKGIYRRNTLMWDGCVITLIWLLFTTLYQINRKPSASFPPFIAGSFGSRPKLGGLVSHNNIAGSFKIHLCPRRCMTAPLRCIHGRSDW